MSAFSFQIRSGSHNRPIWRFKIGQNHNEGLQLIFSHLAYSHLRRCMLVSKSWRKLALEELQARCSARISSEEHIKIILQKLKTSRDFKIGNLTLTSLDVKENTRIHQLFLKIQPTLHFLKLESPVEIQETTLFQILDFLPNLTRLSITAPLSSKHTHKNHGCHQDKDRIPFLSGRHFSNNTNEAEDASMNISNSAENEDGTSSSPSSYKNIRHLHLDLGQQFTFQLSKILQLFPNLFELAIVNMTDEPRKHFKLYSTNSSVSVGSSSLISRYPPVRSLILRQYSNTSFTEKLVQTLMRLNTHLEKLVVIFHPPSSSCPSSSSLLLKQFIESQWESLQSLKLMQVEDDFPSYFNGGIAHERNLSAFSSSYSLPNYYWNFNYSSATSSSFTGLLPMNLPNLRKLHVQTPLITNLAQVLNHFPQLRELSIKASFGSNWKGMLPSKLEPHDNITRLKIDFIDSESFSRLGKCFPSLQNLQLAFCDESLFNVLGDFIPYFNKGCSTSKISKENIFVCQQCHSHMRLNDGKSNTGNNNSNNTNLIKYSNKNTGGHKPSFTKSNNDNDYVDYEKEFPTMKPQQRKRCTFKYLTRLRLRPCVHLPFESFVFLQRDRCIGLNDQATPCKLSYDETFENDEMADEAEDSFSWSTCISLKDEEFADLPSTICDDEQEGCSSA